MSAFAAQVIREIDAAELTAAISPLLVAQFRNQPVTCWEFNRMAPTILVDRDAGHIRRRANANRKRNKSARAARKHNW